MKVSVIWCLSHLSKAYRIHYFEGTISQFKEVLVKANDLGIIFTNDIPDELVDSILKINKNNSDEKNN